MKIIYYLIFCSILLSFPVLGVGISGNLDTETVFKPNTDFGFSFTGIANKGSTPLDHEVTLSSDLSEYVTLEKQYFTGRK